MSGSELLSITHVGNVAVTPPLQEESTPNIPCRKTSPSLDFEEGMALFARTVSPAELSDSEDTSDLITEDPQYQLAISALSTSLEDLFTVGQMLNSGLCTYKVLLSSIPLAADADKFFYQTYKQFKKLSDNAKYYILLFTHQEVPLAFPSGESIFVKYNPSSEVLFKPNVLCRIYRSIQNHPDLGEYNQELDLWARNNEISVETMTLAYLMETNPKGPIEKRHYMYYNISLDNDILEILTEAFEHDKELPFHLQFKNAALLIHAYFQIYPQLFRFFLLHAKDRIVYDQEHSIRMLESSFEIFTSDKEVTDFVQKYFLPSLNSKTSNMDQVLTYHIEGHERFDHLTRQAHPIIDYAKHYLDSFNGDLDKALACTDILIPEVLEGFLEEKRMSLEEFDQLQKSKQAHFYSKEGCFNVASFFNYTYFKQELLFKIEKHLSWVKNNYTQIKNLVSQDVTISKSMASRLITLDDLLNKFSNLNFILTVQREVDAKQVMKDLHYISQYIDELQQEFQKNQQKVLSTLSTTERPRPQKGKKPTKPKRKGAAAKSAPRKAKAIKLPQTKAVPEIKVLPPISIHETIAVYAQPLPKPEPKKPFYVPEEVPIVAQEAPQPEMTEMQRIKQRVNQQIQEETDLNEKAVAFYHQHLKGEEKLISRLFDVKSNKRNFMSQEDMTRIMNKLQRAQKEKEADVHADPVNNLKGAPGVKFRVRGSDVIYATHSHSAQVGGRGHGGAVKDFKNFLLEYYVTHHKE